MEDSKLVDLFWQRSAQAISETEEKYGHLCFQIANHALGNRDDAAETVNDAWMAAWNAIPPARPENLRAFLAKLTRRIAINRALAETAQKRGGGQINLVLEELRDCASQAPGIEQRIIGREACAELNRFLRELPQIQRMVFLRRYFFLDSVGEIANRYGFSEAKVTSMLHRTRKKLRTHLEKEGYL